MILPSSASVNNVVSGTVLQNSEGNTATFASDNEKMIFEFKILGILLLFFHGLSFMSLKKDSIYHRLSLTILRFEIVNLSVEHI